MRSTEFLRSDKDDITDLVEWVAARYDWQTAAMSQELIEGLYIICSHKKKIRLLWLLWLFFVSMMLWLGYHGIVTWKQDYNSSYIALVIYVVFTVIILSFVLFWAIKKTSKIAQTIATDKEKEFWTKYPNFDKEIRNQIYEAIVS